MAITPSASAPRPPGTFRLFRAFGIDVYLHWLWFVLLVYEIQGRRDYRGYSSVVWNLAEFIGIFAIVVLHEFGHALACRSVGGSVRYIVIWLLGGVAFVQPPRRPGAVLWSIAAGPLVNVAIAPVLVLAYVGLRQWAGSAVSEDLVTLMGSLAILNAIVFAFNMLPVYPLDGGQIVQSILWFFLGESLSLRIASVVGMVAAGALLLLAAFIQAWFLVLLAVFIGWQAFVGFSYARRLAAQEREAGFAPPWTDPDSRNRS